MAEALVLPEAAVRKWSTDLLGKAGLPVPAAETVADSLLFAERRGVASHGLVRLRIYLARIVAGGINKDAQIRRILDREAVGLIDGDHAPGAAAAMVAVDVVAEKAQRYGVGVVLVRNGNHFGAAGFYTAALARAGLIGLAACNTDAAMAPPGGGAPVLGTNPLSIAFPPTPQGTFPLLDMATSEVAYGKVVIAREEGRPLAAGWAVDRAGRPTTDPAAALAGALLPAAGPKGFGLAYMLDLLSTLGGAALSPAAGQLYGPPERPQRLGFFFLAIAPRLFSDGDTVAGTIEQLTAAVRRSRDPAHPLGTPMIPGEPEAQQEAQMAGGLALPARLVAELTALGREYALPFPESG